MQVNSTFKLNHMLKKSIISMACIGAVALALASSGGGDNKSSRATSGLTLVKSTPGFNLRAGRSYSLTGREHLGGSFSTENSVVTFRKGNTIYIVPASVKTRTVNCNQNNLNLLNVKFRLRK